MNKVRKYNWELEGTAEQFQKIFNGLEFMNKFPKNKKWKIMNKTDKPFEFLKIWWWLHFPPKKPTRTWYSERIPEKYKN